jgi:hypothetical protein
LRAEAGWRIIPFRQAHAAAGGFLNRAAAFAYDHYYWNQACFADENLI